MILKLGRILKTLDYLIEKNLEESIFSSEAFLKHKWGPLEKQILTLSKHPLVYALLIPLSGFLLFLAAFLLKEYYYGSIKKDLYELRWIFEWQDIILSGQLTLIGVVFPLVIGLIGFLLQGKSASKSIWEIYTRYSGFIFSGFSGLLLAVFIIIGKYIESLSPDYPYIAHSIFSSLWFFANIFLVGWFLWSTFKIIQEDDRDSLLTRFTINNSFVENIRKRLALRIPVSAFRQSTLTLNKSADFEVGTSLISSKNEHDFSVNFGRPKYISSIRFRFLQWAVDFKCMGFDRSGDLTLPAVVDNTPRKKFILATFSKSEGSLITRALIRAAYGFSRNQPYSSDHLNENIFAMVGSVYDSLQASVKRFEMSVENLIYWHCQVSDSLSFRNDDNDIDNWLGLGSGGIFGRSYLEELFYEYHQIVKEATSKIPVEPGYFRFVIHLFPRLERLPSKSLPPQNIERIIHSQYLVWSTVVNWYKSSKSEHSSSAMDNYVSVLISFVGTWEVWLSHMEAKSSRWSNYEDNFDFYISHLKYTAQMVVSSANANDKISSEWAADTLLYWFSNASSFAQKEASRYLWKTPLLVHTLLRQNRDNDDWRYILNGNSFDPITACELAAEHAWKDLRLLTSSYLIVKDPKNELFVSLSRALVSGRRHHSERDSEGYHEDLSHPSEILQSYLRQTWFSEFENQTYSSWISSLVNNFSRIDEPDRVSGRVYSSWGARNAESLRKGFIYLAARNSTTRWSISSSWMDLIASKISSVEKRNNLKREIEKWKIIIDDDIALEGLTGNLKENFNESLEDLLIIIDGYNRDEISQAQIDEQRLLDFASNASRDAFTKENGYFLVSFFKSIDKTNIMNPEQEKILTINDYEKANLALGTHTNRAINEADWMADNVKLSVGSKITREVVFRKQHTTSKFNTATDLVERISNDLKKIQNNEWIILVGSRAVQMLIDEELYNSHGSDFNIEYLDGFESSYLAHLSGVPVYRVHQCKPETVILINREALSSLEFREYDNGELVEVTFSDFDKETLKGKLKFRYQLTVSFDSESESYCYQIINPDHEE